MNNRNGVHLAKSSRFRSVALPAIAHAEAHPHTAGANPPKSPWFTERSWGTLLCALYPVLAIMPMIALHGFGHEVDHSGTAEFAVNCALVGFTLLSMQFILTARFSWLEAPFGLDVVLRFHRAMALLIVTLLCAHPLLLAATQGWTLLTRFKAHWPLWAGRIALILLATLVIVALMRSAWRLSYERWRVAHNAVAVTILALGYVHAARMGDDLHGGWGVTVFVLPPTIALAALFYSRGVRPFLLARNAFRVHSIRSEAPRVWTLTLDSLAGKSLRFLPGQFQFLRFLDSDLPAEEHPFTIASSPTATGRISVTIKSCGGFTNVIERVQPGDRATVQGPFGRFSHDLHPEEGDLVFVAGGVGITPLMSMLRAMRDRNEGRRVTLIYASRTLDDVLFSPELIAMEAAGRPALNVIHVLSDSPDWWTGESGRVNVRRLSEWCDGLEDKAFYLCCPPGMNVELVRGLQRYGVSPRRIHCDYFSL
jgi:predicted ferric reductase